MATQLWAMGLVILATFLGSGGPIFFKKFSNNLTFNIPKMLKNKYLYLGVLSYAVGTILFIPALKGGDLSVLYPLVALTYIWVSFWSIKFLNEKMNKLKWIGIILILIGVFFVGLGS